MKDLIPTEQSNVVNLDNALADWELYQEITKRLLTKKDYQQVGKTRFKKKSAWRKYGKAFNISTRVIEKEVIRDDAGRVLEANFLVRAWTPTGRETEGYGACSKFERGFSKPDHDIPATAMTRAVNRAISDLIGAGEISAEEMGDQTVKKTESIIPPLKKSKTTEDFEKQLGIPAVGESAPEDVFEDVSSGKKVKGDLTGEVVDAIIEEAHNVNAKAKKTMKDPMPGIIHKSNDPETVKFARDKNKNVDNICLVLEVAKKPLTIKNILKHAEIMLGGTEITPDEFEGIKLDLGV